MSPRNPAVPIRADGRPALGWVEVCWAGLVSVRGGSCFFGGSTGSVFFGVFFCGSIRMPSSSGSGVGGVGCATGAAVALGSISATCTTSGPGTITLTGIRNANSAIVITRCAIVDPITALRMRSAPPRGGRWLGDESERGDARVTHAGDHLHDLAIGNAGVGLQEHRTLGGAGTAERILESGIGHDPVADRDRLVGA